MTNQSLFADVLRSPLQEETGRSDNPPLSMLTFRLVHACMHAVWAITGCPYVVSALYEAVMSCHVRCRIGVARVYIHKYLPTWGNYSFLSLSLSFWLFFFSFFPMTGPGQINATLCLTMHHVRF